MLGGLLNDAFNSNIISSKRVVTFTAFILCAIAFISNLYWGYKVEPFMYDSMIYLAMVGLGASVAEKFVPSANVDKLRGNA